MPATGLTLVGLILESHFSVSGHFLPFAVALTPDLRKYFYQSPDFPSLLPPAPPSPPPSWSANQLGGTTDQDLAVVVTFPDSLSPLSFNLKHASSSMFYGYPASTTGSPVTLTGRVLGSVYITSPPPPPPPAPPGPPPPPAPPVAGPMDPSFPPEFLFPGDFFWPYGRARQEFQPWYYLMYYNTLLPILKDLPLATKI